MITSNTRNEKWGHIGYDRDSDEFAAYLRNPRSRPIVSRPLSVGCLVTGRCNLRCPHCYGNEESLPKEELDINCWRDIFRHLRSWGLMRVDISGGEPTLRRDLIEIAREAVGAGLQVVISTNGLPLASKGVRGYPSVRWHVSLDSGLHEIHERRRLLRILEPSKNSLEKASKFISQCIDAGSMVRVLTCVGKDNKDALFALGEHLALLGVRDWNISRVIPAGRAQEDYLQRWEISDESVLEQVQNLRCAFPFLRIRYSNRTHQDGYFLLVLPDGSLATQYTDGRDKVVLGKVLDMSLDDLRSDARFSLHAHGEKWIAATLEWQSATAPRPLHELISSGPQVSANFSR
jgi:MoaA/NifB/PqqE/SkfB family radical SAM enzyme